MVALLTAGLLLLARIFRLGFLADFLSRTVLMGFLAGVGLQVGVAMLGDMLGIPTASHGTLGQLGRCRGLGAAAGCWRCRRRRRAPSCSAAGSRRNLPMALVAVVGMIAASAAFHFAEHGIPVIGPVAGGLPPLRCPR